MPASRPCGPSTKTAAERAVRKLLRDATGLRRLGDPGGARNLENEARYLAMRWGVELPAWMQVTRGA